MMGQKVSKTCIATVKNIKTAATKYKKNLRKKIVHFLRTFLPRALKQIMVYAHENVKRIVMHSMEKKIKSHSNFKKKSIYNMIFHCKRWNFCQKFVRV